MKIILGSQSPRRKQILSHLVDSFEVRVGSVDESYPRQMESKNVPIFLAEKKFQELVLEMGKDELLICADTVVVLGDEIIGKPANPKEAMETLMHLTGKKHVVITGVCLGNKEKCESFSCSTNVYVKGLSEDAIMSYIEKFQPFDKAGSYGIQDWFGHAAVEKIEGCYYNVMGLPASMLYDRLQRMGVRN